MFTIEFFTVGADPPDGQGVDSGSFIVGEQLLPRPMRQGFSLVPADFNGYNLFHRENASRF